MGARDWKWKWNTPGPLNYLNPPNDTHRELLRIIKSARLTCRRLYDIASPFLVDHIVVRIDQASLDRAHEASRNPLIARGVHAVMVDLSCYPAELATSLEVTKTCRRYELWQETHCPNTPDGLRKRVEIMMITTERWDGGEYLTYPPKTAQTRSPTTAGAPSPPPITNSSIDMKSKPAS